MPQLDPKSLYLLSQLCADGQFANAKVEVSGVGKRLQMWQAAGRAALSQAESAWTHGRRGWWWWGGRYGGSVAASHWCALSYVGINHDSEMTYFLTPQTNSTFNRSQGFCQSTFSPCSLSKKRVACRIRLPRHNTEDYIYVFIYSGSQTPSAALLQFSAFKASG